MSEIKIQLCDVCGKQESIAERGGRHYCSCECFLIDCSRLWPAMIDEQTDIMQVRKKQNKLRAAK